VILYVSKTDTFHVIIKDDAWRYLDSLSNDDMLQLKLGDVHHLSSFEGLYYGLNVDELPDFLNHTRAARVLGFAIKRKFYFHSLFSSVPETVFFQ
jgi:hypothetical protein